MILTKIQLEIYRHESDLRQGEIDLLDTIADLERQRDTAHRAAIQAAGDFIEARYQSGICPNDISDLRKL